MSDSKEKEEAKQENPDENLGEEQQELKVSAEAETETELEVDTSISNQDISVETEIEDKSNESQNISVETEIEDKSNEIQNVAAETEIGDKSNGNQNNVVEMEIEDKSKENENISVEIEKEDMNIASQEESPADVKTETRDDLSPPVQTHAEKDGVDDEEKIESAEAPPNPEIETREEEELPGTETYEEQEKPVPEAAEPISSVKLQAENSGDNEEVKKNENENENGNSGSKKTVVLDEYQIYEEGSESGTEEDQLSFMKEIDNFFRERSMDFKPPKFYGEGLNCLKLWRSVIRLGGYDKVTSCKLWRQVGESFRPPKTCTTVSWTFRGFYEKALLDYERHKTNGGELSIPVSSHLEPIITDAQASGSGRARRDAAARAMQGWHSQRLLGNGEVGDPIIKDKGSPSTQKREKQLKTIGLLKRKKPSYTDDVMKSARTKTSKLLHSGIAVDDVGPRADWVKINVQRTKDCFEVYALVPGLLREEVRVQSDPAGWVVISGEPEQLDNPWGLTPFKKVVSLPSRIDSIHTSAVVTLHGQLFIRVPFEQSD